MEIERKYLIPALPENLEQYPHRTIEQGYLCVDPVVRIRRDGDDYYLTYKTKGFLVREEYNLPLDAVSFRHLSTKTDGRTIRKERYKIPYHKGLTIELDIFHGELSPLMLAEVEFPSTEEAESFLPPEWFGEDVTFSDKYHNSNLSRMEL